MHDTDRIARPQVSFADLTPTTAPTWNPAYVPTVPSLPSLPSLPQAGKAGGKRMARGTVPPMPSLRRPPAVVLRQELPEAPALLIRVVSSRSWGQVERIELDRELATAPTTPARRIVTTPDPVVVLGALVIAIATLLIVLAVQAPTQPATPPRIEPTPIASPVITELPEPTPPPAVEVEPEIEIEIEIAPAPAPAPKAPATLAARPPVRPPMPAAPAQARPMADLDGSLAIGAKPPCRILVDGRDTGLMTPQRELRLSEGQHEITLINDEFGIVDRSTVHIGAGSKTRLVRDLSAHL